MNDIIDYYSSFDEWGRLEREPLEFRINWQFIKTNLPPKGKILDNGAGPGKYSMELAKLGYNVTLTDLTPRLVNVAKEKATELDLVNHFSDFFVRDARNLTGLESNQLRLCWDPCIICKMNKTEFKLFRNFEELQKWVVSFL